MNNPRDAQPRRSNPASTILASLVAALVWLLLVNCQLGPRKLRAQDLRNCTYLVPDPLMGQVEVLDVKEGHYSSPLLGMQGNTVSELTVDDAVTYADFEKNGKEGAVVILHYNRRGSADFTALAVLANRNGKPEHVAMVELEDRAIIQGLVVRDGIICVDVLRHGPDDPMIGPTRQSIEYYRYVSHRLLRCQAPEPSPFGTRADAAPSGFSPRAWADYKANNPHSASVLEWIVQDPTRNRVREAYLYQMGQFKHAAPLDVRHLVDPKLIEWAAACKGAGFDFSTQAEEEMQREIHEDLADLAAATDPDHARKLVRLIEIQKNTLAIIQGQRKP